MSSVYFPVVVVFLRRLVNVISTISISNQYLLLKKARANVDPSEQEKQSSLSWKTLRSKVEWPWWTDRGAWSWPLLMEYARMVKLGGNDNLQDSRLLFPWTERDWSWPSLTKMSVGRRPQSQDISKDSPTKTQRRTIQSHDFDEPHFEKSEPSSQSQDTIHRLMRNPALYDPVRAPRYPIVLSHGLYGFDVRGPSSFPGLRMHYWSNVLNILRDKVGAEVIVTSVPGTGSIASRSERLDQQLRAKAQGRGVNILAHSMGGLDSRHLISHIKPTEYAPLSLTTISTPHRGSPFMDWCANNIGIGKIRLKEELLFKTRSNLPSPSSPSPSTPENSKSEAPFTLSLASLPSSFTTLLLSIVDSPAYANLTSSYLNNVFNPATPDDPRVKYFSVAGRMGSVSVWHPLWLPKMVLDGAEEKLRDQMRKEWAVEAEGWDKEGNRPLWAQEDEWGNDGLVTVQSSRWGEFLGIMEGCDHWEMRGARGIDLGVDLSDTWSFGDWGRFVGAWKHEEKQHATSRESKSPQRQIDQAKELEQSDAIVKASTDKLSAVVDWLVEQVPVAPMLSSKGKENAEAETKSVAGAVATVNAMEGVDVVRAGKRIELSQAKEAPPKKKVIRDLAAKEDLERFYMAMSRKLYEEGL